MSGRSYLSIGDVLTLLRQEFPDVTISKIRFLESQGLVNPERTPSGYRKFYEQDVERLRWVLRQQREHFLPLKVIKDRLGDEANGSEPSTPAEAGHAAPARGERQTPEPARVVDPVLVAQGAMAVTPPKTSAPPRPGVPEHVSVGGGQPGRRSVDAPGAAPPSRLAGGGGGSSLYDQEESEGLTLRPIPTDDRGPAPRTAGRDPAEAPRGAASSAEPRPRPAASEDASPRTSANGPAGGTVTASPTPTDPQVAAKDGGTPSAGSARPPKPAPAASRAGSKPSTGSSRAPAGAASGSGGGQPKSKAADAAAVSDMAGMSGASLTLDELASASGLDIAVIEELCEYGLLAPSRVGGGEYYDEEALAVANLVASFSRFGIEPRHLRLYKNAAEREAGFVEQIVLPLVRQRNPEARAKANETADQLIQLGQGLRSSLLRKALRDLLGS
ncbi:MAG TPA: MerR family transcriptional regulator [Acidimicrobiales bacterium]|nr:MerR family transcriptional regulator [Acidimicrobiales bacterium]